MKNVFLIKRDPAKKDDDNWMIMDFAQYSEWLNSSEGRSLKIVFAKLPGTDENDNSYYVECDRAMKRECKKEENAAYYRRKVMKESGYEVLSYHAMHFEDNEISGEDVIHDVDCDVEEKAILLCLVEKLYEAIKTLTDSEKQLVWCIWLSETHMSAREYARQIGVPHSTVDYWNAIVIEKLRAYIKAN